MAQCRSHSHSLRLPPTFPSRSGRESFKHHTCAVSSSLQADSLLPRNRLEPRGAVLRQGCAPARSEAERSCSMVLWAIASLAHSKCPSMLRAQTVASVRRADAPAPTG